MRTTLIQTHLYWEDRKKNIAHFEGLISSIQEKTDLIVLPEMFTTGFSMRPEQIAEPSNGETLTWLKQKAKEKTAVITGSVAVEENGKYFNRLFWVEPDGTVSHYDKRHLFRMAKEDEHYTAGTEKIIKPIKGWKICPLVCYDLRFPVWSRNHFTETAHGSCTAEYDVLLYVANWPEVRNHVWKNLLVARAIENQCYVIALNRVGTDGNDYGHSGDSVVINPRGEVISHLQPNAEGIETISLDKVYLEEFRKTFPVGLDADDFEIK